MFTLLHTDLHPLVRDALSRAAATKLRVLHDNLAIDMGEHDELVNLIVEPLPGPEGEGLFLVAFQQVGHAPKNTPRRPPGGTGEAAARARDDELLTTRERLRKVGEELAAAQLAQQSSHEEYLSVNEELRSANEELETSKEELQSLNEELQTINAELNTRNGSLMRSNSDLANLFDSTSIATLFLDDGLCIRRFTPRVQDIFRIREGDEGRPISDLVTHLADNRLELDLQQVLRTLIPIEREVAMADSAMSYLMQVRPYRDLNNVVDGVAVTFIDISERKKHERARALLASIIESSQDAIISHDLEGIITSWNAGAEQLYGYSALEAIGRSMAMLLGKDLPDDWPQVVATLEKGQQVAHFDSSRTAKDGRPISVSITVSPVREADGRIVGASVVARDISERLDAEQKTRLLLGELDHRVKNILAIVSAVVSQTLKAGLSPEMFDIEVQGRIQAIAKAHSLLTQAGQGEMSLRAFVTTELAPYDRGEGGLAIEGDDVVLTPRAGMTLAMAVHELASNAAKYGALSATSGHLAVRWGTAGDTEGQILTITWTETGGPTVLPPSRRGFGTTLIERALTHELDAQVTREFPASGLRCTIQIPLKEDVGRVLVASKGGA